MLTTVILWFKERCACPQMYKNECKEHLLGPAVVSILIFQICHCLATLQRRHVAIAPGITLASPVWSISTIFWVLRAHALMPCKASLPRKTPGRSNLILDGMRPALTADDTIFVFDAPQPEQVLCDEACNIVTSVVCRLQIKLGLDQPVPRRWLRAKVIVLEHMPWLRYGNSSTAMQYALVMDGKSPLFQ